MKKNMLIYIFSFIIVIANGGPVWVIMIASNSKRFTSILFHYKCLSCFTTFGNLEKNNLSFQDMSKETQMNEVICMVK